MGRQPPWWAAAVAVAAAVASAPAAAQPSEGAQDAGAFGARLEDDAIERDAAEQDAAEQEAAEQDAAERDAAEQDAAEQEAAEQDAAEQDAAEQDAGGGSEDEGPPASVPEAAAGDSRPRRAERSSSLGWVRMPGAEACPSSLQLARAVEARLGRAVFVSAADADLAVEGRVETTEPEGWRAVLQVSDATGQSLGERVLTSAEPGCEELGELVVLTVALMIDPLTATEEAGERTTEREGEPAGGEPEVRTVVRTERVEVPVEVPAPAEPRWRFEIDSALAGSVGLSPTAALGGITTVIVEPPGFVPLVLEGALFPWSRAEREGSGRADLLHAHAGLQICPLALREAGLALHACLGADAGAVFVLDSDLAIDETERVVGQAHAAVRGHWDVIGPLTVRVGLHLLVPFRHEPFTVDDGAWALYTPEPVAAMLDLGVGLHF